MKVRLLILTLLFSVLGWGQTVSYTAFTTITCPATPTATISPAVTGLTFTQISRGAGVTCGAAGGSISGSTFNGTLAANITASKWYTYDVTSDATVSFNVSSLNIVSRVSNITGSPSVSVQYSIGGGAKTVIGSFTPTTTATTYTLPTAIAVGASQTLNIFIIPNTLTAAGTTCRVENNTSITLTTTPSGPAPEINVTGNGNTILTGDVLPTTTDFTDFGNVNLGSSVADSFVVENTGTANLTVSSVVISGTNAADFAVTTSPVGTIASAGNSGLAITFTPSALGLRNATVTINNNDSNESAYTFAIVGNGTCVPPANPAGAITLSANPSCGPATLSYPAGSYWQTTAAGTLTTSPTSSNYTLNASGTVYIRNFNGTCWSTSAINSGAITINTPVAITTQPVASVIFSGSNTTFSVAATGTGLSYQWQVDTGSGFTNLTNVAPYSNVTTATMNITAATVGMNGYLYRCVVSGATPCASVTSSSALLTVTVYVPVGTVLKPGDLVFVGYDSTAHATCAGADDRFYMATLVDILPGTQFLVVNSRYESGAAANVRTDRWYGSGSPVYEDPGILTFTWTGAGSLPAGSIISFVSDSTFPAYASVSEVRINDILEPLLTAVGSYYPCNISSGDPDQIYIMQGLFTPFGVIGTDRYNTFTGRVLYGLTNGRAWVPFTSSVSAGTTGGTTRQSRLPDDIECFNIESTTLNGVRFYNNSSLHTGTKNQLLSALNTVGNWTIPANTNCLNVVEDFTGVTGAAVGKPFVITIGNPDGTWTGATDTDWFKCANWEGLSVPKATDDVIVPAAPVNQPIIGASPLKYPIGAFSNNLTLDSASTLGMPNALSRLNLYANWTNNSGSANFSEGIGTVYFEGSTPQIINGVTPEGTETFHHLVLNNNFTTSVSNDIIANGDLTVGVGKTLVVSPNDYVQVTDNVTNNGTFSIKNTGSLIQVNDTGVDIGNINMERIATMKLLDYSYWSAPVGNGLVGIFPVQSLSPLTPAGYIFKWGTTTANANGGQGTWVATAENMIPTKGYILRAPAGFTNAMAAPLTANFIGKPNNGVYSPTISRGTDFSGPGLQGMPRVATDDNWNLIGNPYPSAIGVNEFLTLPANNNIQGFVKIWTHGQLPTNTTSPFYQSYVSNYYPNDYSTVNLLAATSGPGDYKIGAGQGFMVLMNAGLAGSSTVTFNNAMRNRTFVNNQFFKSANASYVAQGIEKHRIWLDLVTPTGSVNRTVVGYATEATQEEDRLFDAFTDNKANENFYSLIENKPMVIQGRALPFDINDKVSMGVQLPTNGTYTIAIATVDGLFTGKSQKIYIEDKLLGTITDITEIPYQFTATQGIINDRFVLRYTNQTLSNTDFELSENAITVFASNNEIKINSSSENIKDYIIYNILGQTLSERNNVNVNQSAVSSIQKNNQALFVKVILTNGKTVIKKIIF